MCGIAGVSLRPGVTVDPARLVRMRDALAHRGPDGKGAWEAPGAVLLHRRLSIIDVAGGAQPIVTSDGTAAIVANGEIYNYRALQEELRRAGVDLRTRSDSEVALHRARLDGERFAERLRGMYALAVHDARDGTTRLARDPFGIKPLYLACGEEGVAFASEPQALAAGSFVARSVRTGLVQGFLERQYVPGEACLWAGIERVLPGETITLREGRIVGRWRRRPVLDPAQPRDEATALAELDRLIGEATALHLQSEVPYAAFLSGGIDSTIVVTAMARLVERPRTYTVGFADPSVPDERSEAERVARAVGATHVGIGFDAADFWAELPAMAAAMDDPVADYACLPVLALARRAAQDVKVVLSGEGGDEIFAGYGRYRARPLERLRGLLAAGGRDGLTPLQERQLADIDGWLPADLLTKLDRCLMAHGIEGRVPLLDDRLAAFGFALPDRLKRRGRLGKWLLRRWLETERAAIDPYARKRGFTVPIRAWLEQRRAGLTDWIDALGAASALGIEQELDGLRRGPLDKKGAQRLFAILCLVMWHERHIRGADGCDALPGIKIG